MKLFAFHIALITFGKIKIQPFSLQLWVNSRANWALSPCYGNQSRRKNSIFKPVRLRLEIDLVLHPAHDGRVEYIYIYICVCVCVCVFTCARAHVCVCVCVKKEVERWVNRNTDNVFN